MDEKLDRELLQNIFEAMGYEVKFDSDTPGISEDGEIIEWEDIAKRLVLQGGK